MPSPSYDDLDVQPTPLGERVLRRRRLPVRARPEIWEILLDGAFLMSSLVHESESALATRGLDACRSPTPSVLVGGLGLGWTAKAALDAPGTRAVTVVELLAPVLRWHERGLVPLGRALAEDPRCRLVEGDVFGRIRERRDSFDAILLDVDHSPRAVLDPAHAAFYEVAGLEDAAARLEAGGVLGVWSADAPDAAFLRRLESVFAWARVDEIRFANPSVGAVDLNTLYFAGAP